MTKKTTPKKKPARRKPAAQMNIAAKRRKFLKGIEAGLTTPEASENVGVSRFTPHQWKRADPTFAKEWADLLEVVEDVHADILERSLFIRATDGWDEPVFYEGNMCGVKRKFSDPAAMFLLKGMRPEKYADRKVELDQYDDMTEQQLLELYDNLGKQLAPLIAQRSKGR